MTETPAIQELHAAYEDLSARVEQLGRFL